MKRHALNFLLAFALGLGLATVAATIVQWRLEWTPENDPAPHCFVYRVFTSTNIAEPWTNWPRYIFSDDYSVQVPPPSLTPRFFVVVASNRMNYVAGLETNSIDRSGDADWWTRLPQ